MQYDSIEIALSALSNGSLVIVTNDAIRESEGYLIIAAEKMTPEHMAFMVRHSNGVVCVSLPQERAKALQLPPMEHSL